MYFVIAFAQRSQHDELAASFVAQSRRSDTSPTGPEDLSSVESPRSSSLGRLLRTNLGILAMVHLPFADRVEAGRLLAIELSSPEIAETQSASAVVLALTRGGVPVGFTVADRLRIPLEIIVVRKLGVPWQPELAMGAIAGGTRILDDQMIRATGNFLIIRISRTPSRANRQR